MKKVSLKPNLNVKKSRKQVFPEQMGRVVQWAALIEHNAPRYLKKSGLPSFSLHTVLSFCQKVKRHKLAEQILGVVNDHLRHPEVPSGQHMYGGANEHADAGSGLEASSEELWLHKLLEVLIQNFVDELAKFPQIFCKLVHVIYADCPQPKLFRYEP